MQSFRIFVAFLIRLWNYPPLVILVGWCLAVILSTALMVLCLLLASAIGDWCKSRNRRIYLGLRRRSRASAFFRRIVQRAMLRNWSKMNFRLEKRGLRERIYSTLSSWLGW